MASEARPVERSGAGVAAAIAAAVLIAAPFTSEFEGLRTHPYKDPAGIPTVCFGETERAMRTYTADECAVMLRARQAKDYATPILQCVPGLFHRPHAFAASMDAAYNAGVPAFCRSRMARSFNAGDWRGGCNGFPGWYATARINGNPTPLRGLQRRRVAEQSLCLKDPS